MTPAQVAASLDAWEAGYAPDPDPWAAWRQACLDETSCVRYHRNTNEAARCGEHPTASDPAPPRKTEGPG